MPHHSFSQGRPDKHVFQVVSTENIAPVARFDFWAADVIRTFIADAPEALRRKDFLGRVVSLAWAGGEMHHVVADSLQVHRPLHAAREELSLFLMLDGRARVTYEGGAVQSIGAGEFFLLDGTCTTAVSWTRHAMIQLDVSRHLMKSAFSGSLPAPARVNAALARSPLTGLLRSQLTQFSPLAPELAETEQLALLEASESLAIATMAGAFAAHEETGRPGRHKGLLAAAQKLMHRQLDDPDLDVAAIVRQLGCSRATLYRAFAKQGLGVAEYLSDLRLRKAYRLLQEASSRHTIADLAARCGFIEHASFSRLFRQRFGVRPSDVRHQRQTP